jgi:hypothetical protein
MTTTTNRKPATRKANTMTPAMQYAIECLEVGEKWPVVLERLGIEYRTIEEWKKGNTEFAERLAPASSEAPKVRKFLRRLEQLAKHPGAILAPGPAALLAKRKAVRDAIPHTHPRTRTDTSARGS